MAKFFDQKIATQRAFAWFGLFFLLLAFKTAHITLFKHSYWKALAERSQTIRRVLPAPRGEIFDRHGELIAQNARSFDACIFYGELLNLSRKEREDCIEKLSLKVAKSLHIDPEELKDEIYAKAAQNPHTPFVISNDLTSNAFYELKAIEKMHPGLIVRESHRRTYPKGKLLSGVLGYLGAIDQKTYKESLQNLAQYEELLRLFNEGLSPKLPIGIDSIDSLQEKISELKSKAYFFSDLHGKAGVEKAYDAALRGMNGQEIYDIDSRGIWKYKRSESVAPIPGQSLHLTISAKLQEHVEKLLIENDALRRGKSAYYSSKHKCRLPLKEPWIKGGAIVVIEPSTGEVLALGTSPRYDPNDFHLLSSPVNLFDSTKASSIHKWLESPKYIEAIWNQKMPLEKEVLLNGKIQSDKAYLTWELYLNRILSGSSALKAALNKTCSLRSALKAVETVEKSAASKDLSIAELCELSPDRISDATVSSLFKALQTPYSRKLYFDLLNLATDAKALVHLEKSPALNRSLDEHFQDNKNFLLISDFVRDEVQKVFHTHIFLKWKTANAKSYLKNLRHKEKEEGRYARPYTLYLKQKERALFDAFWGEHKEQLIGYFLHSAPKFNETLAPYYRELDTWKKELHELAHRGLNWTSSFERLSKYLDTLSYEDATLYLKSLRPFSALNSPLIGKYPGIKAGLLKDLASAFYPRYGFGYMVHKAFQASSAPGSIFKLVPAFGSLIQREKEGLKDLNPLTLIDAHEKRPDGKGFISVAKTLKNERYPRIYKEGRLIQSARKSIGKIELTGALAQTSNPYFSILAKDHLASPGDLIETAKVLGFGVKSGIDLPFELEGSLPTDLESNPSGLYAAAIGQHTVQATPLQVGLMLCRLGAKNAPKPYVTSHLEGLKPSGQQLKEISSSFCFQKLLSNIGIDFPLFVEEKPLEQCTTFNAPKITPFPISNEVQGLLLQGMKRVTQDPVGTAHPKNITLYPKNHEAIQAYRKLHQEIVGKTSTAEVIETISLEEDERARVYKNTWFGGIAFPDKTCSGNPELVVIVYLPYGAGGKDPAPLMASVVKKWREIKARAAHQSK